MRTLAFFIAHFFHYAVFGALLVGLSLYTLLKSEPRPSSPVIEAALTAPAADLATPLAWASLLIGAAVLVVGWFKAAELRG